MTRQSIGTEAITRATNIPWVDWLDWLEAQRARDLSHQKIAERIRERGDVSGWWAQTITVAYEQHIGRRVPGQDCDGNYQVAVSKTLPSSMDEALARWSELMAGVESLSDIPLSRGPETSSTQKWRYWRCGLADGSRVSVHVHQKAADKAALGIQHDKLESPDQVEHWRAFWKARVREL